MVELKNNNIEPKLISHLLEKRGVCIPLTLIKNNEVILRIERALRNKSIYELSKIFEDLSKPENLEKIFNLSSLDNFIRIVKEFREKYNLSISSDDERIIDYIVKLEEFKYDFILEIISPLYFLFRVIEETMKFECLPKIIRFFIILNSYVFLYELILYQIDRRLYYNIKKLEEYKNKNWYKQFFEKINRSNQVEHATAGLLNEIFSDILNLSKENDSIFGGKSEAKIFRNKIAHANISYNEETEEIMIGSNKYKSDEFLKLFFRLLGFCVRWLEKSLETKIEDSESFKNKIISNIKDYFYWVSRLFLKIERSGEPKSYFMNLIISWEREAGLS